LNLDLSLAMVRKVQEVRPDLKIAVMSATLDVAAVASFLNDCPVHVSAGRLFPVEIHYADRASSSRLDYAQIVSAVETALQGTIGNVLVFLPGVGEIRQAGSAISSQLPLVDAKLFELYGDLPLAKQQEVLHDSNARKIILATNVAETSVTVAGVTAVVDAGLSRVLRLDPNTGINRLQIERISKASTDQRTGRAGRTERGVCYRLWTAAEQRGLADFDQPEVLRVDVSGPILELLVWGEHDVRQFPWYEPPNENAIQHALTLLTQLGALDTRGVTALGKQMARLPVHPRIAKLLLEGATLNVGHQAAIMAALLSERSPFRKEQKPARQLASHRSDSDVLDRLHAIEEFQSTKQLDSPVGRLDPNATKNLLRTAEQLERSLREVTSQSKSVETSDQDQSLKRVLLAAYPDRVARRRTADSRRAKMVGGRGVRLGDESAVDEAEFFVCAEIEEKGTSEALVRLASAVDPAWLTPTLQSTSTEVEFDSDRQRMVAWRRTRFADLVISESQTALPADVDVSALLAAELASRGVQNWKMDEESQQYIARLACLRQWMPELELPDLGTDPLLELLPELCVGCTSVEEVQRSSILQAVKRQLSHDQQRAIQREAPAKLTVPSGSQISLQYELGHPPVLAVRIQELFGMPETPRIAGGRVQVLLHLLGPNYRPQQVTTDLASFWNTTYAEVRKELRRRYPKHAWPEDPRAATPERRGNSRRT